MYFDFKSRERYQCNAAHEVTKWHYCKYEKELNRLQMFGRNVFVWLMLCITSKDSSNRCKQFELKYKETVYFINWMLDVGSKKFHKQTGKTAENINIWNKCLRTLELAFIQRCRTVTCCSFTASSSLCRALPKVQYQDLQFWNHVINNWLNYEQLFRNTDFRSQIALKFLVR